MDKYNEIFKFIDEASEVLSEILSSGFNTCHDYTIEKIKNIKETAHNYGLEYGAEKLDELYNILYLKKHNFEFDFDSAIEHYCIINEYFLICREKLEVENVKVNLMNYKAEDRDITDVEKDMTNLK